jgi:hypothetical protein
MSNSGLPLTTQLANSMPQPPPKAIGIRFPIIHALHRKLYNTTEHHPARVEPTAMKKAPNARILAQERLMIRSEGFRATHG